MTVCYYLNSTILSTSTPHPFLMELENSMQHLSGFETFEMSAKKCPLRALMVLFILWVADNTPQPNGEASIKAIMAP